MIYIKNVLTLDHEMIDYTLESPFEEVINATGLTLFPSIIDPHVRVDESSSFLGWKFLTRSTLTGGVSQILTRSQNELSCHQNIRERESKIEKQIKAAKIPLNAYSFATPQPRQLDNLPITKPLIKGIYLSDDSPFLLSSHQQNLERLFRLASEHNLPISYEIKKQALTQELHTILSLVQKYHTKVYLYPVFKPSILRLIGELKSHSFPVFCGTYLSYLFAHHFGLTGPSKKLQRIQQEITPDDTKLLWHCISEGICDCVGSNYQLHKKETPAQQPFFQLNSFETMELTFPLMLQAVQMKMLSIETFINVTRKNAGKIFDLPSNQDVVLVNMNENRHVKQHLFRTIGDYSSVNDLQFKSWPIYTISQGRSFKLFTKS